MNENHRDVPPIAYYSENRRRCFPPESLVPYAGQWVAFLADGTKIVAHHEDYLTLSKMVAEAGYGPLDVVLSAISPLDESIC
jgi:hypothetical protein